MRGRLLYECTVCGTRNKPEETYCTKCGQWLLSTTHPPKVIRRSSVYTIVAKSIGGTLAVLVGLLLVVGVWVSISESSEDGQLSIVEKLVKGVEGVVNKGQDNSSSLARTVRNKGFGERSNPVPIGQRFEYELQQTLYEGIDKFYTYSIALQVNDVVRGEAFYDILWEQVSKYDFYTEYLTKEDIKSYLDMILPEGFEYLLADITVELLESESDVPFELYPSLLSLVSSGGIQYPSVFDEGPKAVMYEGSVYTGGFIYIVEINDPRPLLESVGVWFSTN